MPKKDEQAARDEFGKELTKIVRSMAEIVLEQAKKSKK